MTLNQLRNEIDSRLENLWPKIVTRQENYLASNGRYWQGNFTQDTIPSAVTADVLYPESVPTTSNVPPSEQGTWANIQNFPLTICYRARIDNYDGPQGKGFVGTVQVKFNGTIYERSQNHGPEPWRIQAWHIYTEPENTNG